MTELKGQSFWATLPGLVTAIAGMVTAVAILVATLSTLPAFQPTASSSPTGAALASGAGVSAAPVTDTAPPSASSAGATAAATASSAASSTPPGTILLYPVRTDPDTSLDNADLYAVDPDTGVERRLTVDPRPDSYPSRSPDGRRIAFDSRRGDGNRNIWILAADGSYTSITADARDDGYPTWSPDGSQLAWAAGPAGEREIWVMDAGADGPARRVTTGADDLQPSWLTNGLIAFERHGAPTPEIWVVDPSGGGATARITAADGGGTDPSWSPDGRRIAFSRPVDGVRRIFVADADGQSNLRSVTAASTCDCDEPTWSPDGSQIAYVGPGAPGSVIRPILVIAADGGSARRMTTNGLGPSWGS